MCFVQPALTVLLLRVRINQMLILALGSAIVLPTGIIPRSAIYYVGLLNKPLDQDELEEYSTTERNQTSSEHTYIRSYNHFINGCI